MSLIKFCRFILTHKGISGTLGSTVLTLYNQIDALILLVAAQWTNHKMSFVLSEIVKMDQLTWRIDTSAGLL